MQVRENYEKVKTHLRENKATYLVGAGCFGAGVVGTMLLRRPIVAQTANTQALVMYKSPVTNTLEQTTVLARRGHPGFVVKCIETGEVFASQRRAAEAMGISRPNLVQHLQGLQESVNGLHFENLGEAVA